MRHRLGRVSNVKHLDASGIRRLEDLRHRLVSQIGSHVPDECRDDSIAMRLNHLQVDLGIELSAVADEHEAESRVVGDE